MSRRKKDPLRPLTDSERATLTQLSRSQAAPAAQVARATMLLAVARGDDSQAAAHTAGRRSGDAVAHPVARFNDQGIAALTPRHGGGRSPAYDQAARQRILREVKRTPTPDADGTATRSLYSARLNLSQVAVV
jgi:transposase